MVHTVQMKRLWAVSEVKELKRKTDFSFWSRSTLWESPSSNDVSLTKRDSSWSIWRMKQEQSTATMRPYHANCDTSTNQQTKTLWPYSNKLPGWNFAIDLNYEDIWNWQTCLILLSFSAAASSNVQMYKNTKVRTIWCFCSVDFMFCTALLVSLICIIC